MDAVLFLLHITILAPFILFSRGGKIREIPIAMDIIFAGGKFRAKSKFANIAKISSARKIGVTVEPLLYDHPQNYIGVVV